jgi:hypothetical protein
LQPLRKGADVLRKGLKGAEKQGRKRKGNASKNHQKIKKIFFGNKKKVFTFATPNGTDFERSLRQRE